MKITESICTGNRRYKAAQKFTPKAAALHSIGCAQPNAAVLIDERITAITTEEIDAILES